MPILDFDLEFTEGVQAITATAVGNHVLDSQGGGGAIGATASTRGRDWGSGERVVPAMRVIAAFNNLTSLQVDIIASDANDGTGNPVVLSTSGAILLAALLANTLFSLPSLKPGVLRRFLVAKFTVVGTAPTLGTVRAWLQSPSAEGQAGPQDGVNYL